MRWYGFGFFSLLALISDRAVKKWMRIDFREERKWKIALAYELGTAVLEWHQASSREERKRRGIIVEWQKPPAQDSVQEDDDQGQDVMDVDMSQPEQEGLLVGVYGSDDSDDEPDQDKQDVIDALETSNLIDEALDNAGRPSGDVTPPTTVQQVQLKVEDVEDHSVLRGDDISTAMDVNPSQDNNSGDVIKEESGMNERASALKPTSDDPMFISVSLPGELPSTRPSPTKQAKSNTYAPLRSQIAYSDERMLFLNLADLVLVKDTPNPSEGTKPADIPLHPSDLSAIFPIFSPIASLRSSRRLSRQPVFRSR